jgi:hypothetical protein
VNGLETRLDRCVVTVSPALNPDHEHVLVPDDLVRAIGVRVVYGDAAAPFAADVSGAAMVYDYERLLRQLTYTNRKPAYYLSRQFSVECSQMNGRFTSNEFVHAVRYINSKVLFFSR